ncbi:hypothetical protein LX32DRAFT_156304 [Colletotrichum zoysiae]|uniref:Uncharacterized protein n=1 Tax=Colletotrichum zoysiae TaxID=1216348 RepID=A0AAD9HPR5_9PEZI|nr:hypothetical protein LX32DRAFT_156304 [Colletotrichum zoysiae]
MFAPAVLLLLHPELQYLSFSFFFFRLVSLSFFACLTLPCRVARCCCARYLTYHR